MGKKIKAPLAALFMTCGLSCDRRGKIGRLLETVS